MLINENQDLGPNKHQRSTKLERQQQRLSLNQKKFSVLGPLSPYQMLMEVLTPMCCVMVHLLQNTSPAKGLPQLQATCGTSLRHWRQMKCLVPDHHLILPFTRLSQTALTWDVICVCEYICTFSDGRFTNIHFTRCLAVGQPAQSLTFFFSLINSYERDFYGQMMVSSSSSSAVDLFKC